MKVLHRILALIALCAWLSAGAHVALEHGGDAQAALPEQVVQGDHRHDHHHHDDEVPTPADGHHHHELSSATVSLAKSVQKGLHAPQPAPIGERLLAELALLLRGSEIPGQVSVYGDSPPDLRMSGWLFVAQTARPVRGPSLA